MTDKIDVGVPTKVLVKCEECGHQAIMGVLVIKGHLPSFYCSWCNAREPLVERVGVDRSYKSIR
jgi:hypothetical protein